MYHLSRLVCLLLIFSLLASTALSAFAGPFEIKQLDPDEGGIQYSFWLASPRRAVAFPMNVTAEMYEESPDHCILLVGFSQFGEVFGAFFAFRNDELAQKDLSQYTDAEMPAALKAISKQPEAITFERYGELASGVTGLVARETKEDSVARHFVVFQNGWVYNMMTQVRGSEIPEGVFTVADSILKSMFAFQEEMFSDIWDSGNGFSLRVPEPLMLHRPDMGDSQFAFAYICPDRTGPLKSLGAVYRMDSGMLASAELNDLSPDALQVLMQSAGLRADPGSALERVEGYSDIMGYTASGLKVYCALSGGMLLLAVDLPRAETEVWDGSLALAALESLLGRKPIWPQEVRQPLTTYQDGDTLVVPVEGFTLRLAVPEGYAVNAVLDDPGEKFIGLENGENTLYILRVMDIGRDFGNLLTPDHPDRVEAFDALSGFLLGIAKDDLPGVRMEAAYQSVGLLGLPGGEITGGHGQYRMAFCMVDRRLLVLSAARGSEPAVPGTEALNGMLSLDLEPQD